MLFASIRRSRSFEWGNGTSHRFLLEADGMGYTVTDTIVKAGTKSLIEYKNHLEACYCIEGSGSVIEMDGTEHKIVVGTMYALDKHDPHYLLGGRERGPAARLHVHAGAPGRRGPRLQRGITLRTTEMDELDRRAEGAAEVARASTSSGSATATSRTTPTASSRARSGS